ncbi:MAG: hypothetical protein JEZ03_06910 [Bacteroidales bacterium]|nr:hypothetical protein [Bacteroidales bacterium]
MGKYDTFMQRKPKKQRVIHPIWRGIGFAFLFIIPIISYFGMELILDLNEQTQWFPLPMDLLLKGQNPYLLIKLFVFFILVFILYAVLTLITFFINKIFGPGRYGLYDVPSVSYRGKKYKR